MGSTAEDLISEELALEAVGVSGNTLQRFAEAGYLKTQSASDGKRQYFKSELSKVFGIKDFKLYDFQAARQERAADNLSVQASAPAEELAPEDSVESDGDSAELVLAEQNEIINNLQSAEMPTLEDAHIEDVILTPSFGEAGKASTDTGETRADERSSSAFIQLQQLEAEVTKLKAISELQEKLLELREQEISDLKSQRQWLQERVEKMEEKATRDQMLLLTETQILTKMISMRDSKSPIQKALGWLGLSKSNNQ